MLSALSDTSRGLDIETQCRLLTYIPFDQGQMAALKLCSLPASNNKPCTDVFMI